MHRRCAPGVQATGPDGATGPTGATGATGAIGPAGSNGANGTNGTNGTNGLNSIMLLTAEPAGAHCTYGGTKVQVGLDTDGNGALQASEVTSTTYLCSAA